MHETYDVSDDRWTTTLYFHSLTIDRLTDCRRMGGKLALFPMLISCGRCRKHDTRVIAREHRQLCAGIGVQGKQRRQQQKTTPTTPFQCLSCPVLKTPRPVMVKSPRVFCSTVLNVVVPRMGLLWWWWWLWGLHEGKLLYTCVATVRRAATISRTVRVYASSYAHLSATAANDDNRCYSSKGLRCNTPFPAHSEHSVKVHVYSVLGSRSLPRAGQSKG